MLNIRQARIRLEKLAPNTFVEARRVYRTYSDGRRHEECEVWVGMREGILNTGKTFDECLDKVKAELEARNV